MFSHIAYTIHYRIHNTDWRMRFVQFYFNSILFSALHNRLKQFGLTSFNQFYTFFFCCAALCVLLIITFQCMQQKFAQCCCCLLVCLLLFVFIVRHCHLTVTRFTGRFLRIFSSLIFDGRLATRNSSVFIRIFVRLLFLQK